jgi:transcription elongation factor Elf1
MSDLKIRIMAKFFDEYFKEYNQEVKRDYKFLLCCNKKKFALIINQKLPFRYGQISEVAMGHCGGLGYTPYIVYKPEKQNEILIDDERTEKQYIIKCESCGKRWEVEITSKNEIYITLQEELERIREFVNDEDDAEIQISLNQESYKEKKSKLNEFGELIEFEILQ